MCKTSFVIPTKNSGQFIEQCLSSLVPYYKQGYIEDIVIVDALSTDDTLEIAGKYPVKIVSDDSSFPAPSWEKGWRNAGGDLIVFFDSDAYLGRDFFPKLLDYFHDDRVGIVSCEAIPMGGDDRLTLAEYQWAIYHREAYFFPRGFIQRLFRRVRLRNRSSPLPSGPCWVTRRSIIESVDGYRGFPLSVEPDTALPYRIMERGWKTQWWLGSPVYHYTRTTLKSLIKRCTHHGKQAAFWGRELKRSPFRQTTTMAVDLGAPLVGLIGAVHWRNPWFFVFAMTRYAGLAGYLAGLVSRSGERIE
ncbi:glycosyltransferase family 2 protein [Chloroflexota bacterium]